MLGDQLRGGTGGGVIVSAKSVGGLAAVGRAVSLASEAVAKRKLAVWRGDDVQKARVTATWQARLFRGNPNERESWFDVFEQTEASLTGRNNALWLKLKDDLGRIAAVYFISRERFEARWNKDTRRAEYRIRDGSGSSWSDWLDSSNVLHFRVGHAEPGSLVAPTPIEIYRDALRAALSKVRFESNHYDHGILNSLAVTFPLGVKPEQARRFRDMMKAEHGGVENSAGTRVFGNGATVSDIGISLADAQFIESMNFDVEQISRIYRVAASLLGGATGANVRAAPTPEHEEDRWYRYGLEPRLTRIEETIKADPDFFGSASRDYPGFLAAQVRGDVTAESERIVREVQSGLITPNEGRAEKGYPPHPDGDILQITPVGGTPNDVPPSPAPAGN